MRRSCDHVTMRGGQYGDVRMSMYHYMAYHFVIRVRSNRVFFFAEHD